uniref:Uncharacterized protein n=1 Tax=Romanomermis culicivorax TaxID=13658 RepID=A0A915IIB7_ROMCU
MSGHDDAPIGSSGDEELSEIHQNIEELVNDKDITVDCEIVGHNRNMAQIISGGNINNAQNGFLGPTFKADKRSG